MGCPRCGNFPTDDGEVEIFECDNNPQHIFCNGCGNGTKHERSYVLREAGWFWPEERSTTISYTYVCPLCNSGCTRLRREYIDYSDD
ncbi:hypothetical protein ACVWZL_008890 [Bradyrhizobium sp. GM2.4]